MTFPRFTITKKAFFYVFF